MVQAFFDSHQFPYKTSYQKQQINDSNKGFTQPCPNFKPLKIIYMPYLTRFKLYGSVKVIDRG